MRPGPGLVVMALAFISGARRASTTNTISSSGSGGSSHGSSSSSSSSITITTTKPAITTTKTTGTTLPSSYDSATSDRAGGGGGFAFLLPTLHDDSSPGDVAPARDSFQLNFDLYTHSRAPDESLPASSTRRARSLGTSGEVRVRAIDAGTESVVGAPESSEATLISENEETGEISDREREEQEQQQDEEQDDNSGLPVQYASSRSAFDEDSDTDTVADEDIFALVAEDDLLSEESFDRLIKLSEDADSAAAAEEEEDYNLAASVALTQQEQKQQQQQQQQQREPKTEFEPEKQDESRLIDKSVLHAKHIESERENANSNNNNKRETREHQQKEQEQKEIRINDAYASHLIAIAQKDGGNSLPSAVVTTATTTATPATGASTAEPVDVRKSILGTATALTRLNPWISACDLAQPGITGTDLQGQCSAGTLPMAWVDEGPGPPICPNSCAEQQPSDSSAEARTDNKIKYFINANTINFKSPHTRFSHNNNYKAMPSRLRRDRQWEQEDAVDNEPTEAAATAAASTTEQYVELDASTLSATSSSSSSDVDELEDQSVPTLLYSHLQTHEQLNANEQQQQQPPQQQQQQCLDYLGDAAETSPQHLCGLRSPGQLLARLRTLRLRHCCERSVFNALHTLALNATLEDRDECVRLLSDLLDVDALANRITCELAEILFRFDCRQVYSLVNQCDDCKEAYRRWVCSTLVPYYAEQQDVYATPADDLANRGAASAATGKSKRAAQNNAGEWTGAGSGAGAGEADAVAGGKADGTGSIKHKSQKLISNNNKSNNGNNMNERHVNQQHDEDNEPQNKNPNDNASRKRNVANVANVAQAFYDVVGIRQHQTQFHSQSHSSNKQKLNSKSRGAIAKQQFNNFISTAKNADPRAADPVISKLQKRSTRKAEFHKRRRIRPCLSVCQTVEQKCPYLLPADRAPALPTQYAGEPTFVCLDQNIPETGEQLKKSSYGPNDCCYKYCNGPIEGICTICQEFAPTSDRNSNNSSSSRRVHNITLTMSSPPGEHARAASVSLALRNISQAEKQPTAAGAELLERLPYYARYDSVYYYDDDEGSDMPNKALSSGCPPVPSVITRCEIPYYASGVAPSPPTQLLVWLSALLGLLSSCGAARQRCGRARNTKSHVQCPPSCHELLASSNSNPRSSLSRSQSGVAQHGEGSGKGKGKGKGSGSRRWQDSTGNGHASYTANHKKRQWAWSWAWAWLWAWPLNACVRKVRYFRSSSRSKLKCKMRRRWSKARCRIINYRDLQQLQKIRIKCSDRNRNARNYRYFYYYNYNINDWWRRWKWFIVCSAATIISNGAL